MGAGPGDQFRKILPGFMMPFGSSAVFSDRITASASCPCSCSRNSRLPIPHPVLAAARAAQGQGACDDLAVQRPGALQPVRLRRHQDHGVEIPVADMADYRGAEAGRQDVLLGADHRLGQFRDRHDGVGGDALVARLRREGRPVGVVARLPQPRAGRRFRWPIGSRWRRTRGRCPRPVAPARSPPPWCRGTRRTASARRRGGAAFE